MADLGLIKTPCYRDPKPGDRCVILTREMIHVGVHWDGFSKAQLACLGVTWDEARRKGWLSRLVGKRVRKEDYDRYVVLRNNPKTKAKR